jgi:hypothetical protein
MVPIPPQMLEELRLRADQPVRLVSEGGAIGIEPATPPPAPDVVEFAARFIDEYRDVMRELVCLNTAATLSWAATSARDTSLQPRCYALRATISRRRDGGGAGRPGGASYRHRGVRG